jgi:hypothetical protein
MQITARRLSHILSAVAGVLILLPFVVGPFTAQTFAKTLYSYSDEKGIRVITDDYNRIPAQYQSRVTSVEQEADQSEGSASSRRSAVDRVGGTFNSANGFVIDVPGMSFQQSKIITYAGFIALLCIVAMSLSRSQGIRMLALWCLIMTGICAPVLVYIANDGASAIMKNKAAQIQQKQQDRLSHAQ